MACAPSAILESTQKESTSKYADEGTCAHAIAADWLQQLLDGKALFRMEGLMVATLQQLDCIIDSFQQKQPDLPGIEESGIPGKDYIPVEWVDACEKFGKWKIVKQEQPKVDLNAEIEKELRLHYNDDQDVYWWNYLKNSFRHFYEFGLNARKEE